MVAINNVGRQVINALLAHSLQVDEPRCRSTTHVEPISVLGLWRSPSMLRSGAGRIGIGMTRKAARIESIKQRWSQGIASSISSTPTRMCGADGLAQHATKLRRHAASGLKIGCKNQEALNRPIAAPAQS
jgi:hypothetical protein